MQIIYANTYATFALKQFWILQSYFIIKSLNGYSLLLLFIGFKKMLFSFILVMVLKFKVMFKPKRILKMYSDSDGRVGYRFGWNTVLYR